MMIFNQRFFPRGSDPGGWVGGQRSLGPDPPRTDRCGTFLGVVMWGTPKGQGRVVSSVAFTTVSSCICTYSFGFFFTDSEPWARSNFWKVPECWWFGDVGQRIPRMGSGTKQASTVGSWVSSGCLDMLNRCCLINKMSTRFPIIIPSESTTMRHTSSPIVMIYQIRYTLTWNE